MASAHSTGMGAALARGVIPGAFVVSASQGGEVIAWRELLAHRVGDRANTPEPDVRLPFMQPVIVLALAAGNSGYPYALLLVQQTLAWTWTGLLRPLEDAGAG